MIPYIFLAITLVSILSLIGAVSLLFSDRLLRRSIFILVSLSVGALFGDVFIHLLPELAESGYSSDYTALGVLSGIIIFFILEKFIRWRHSHGHDEESADTARQHIHTKSHISTMVFLGDGLHNFLDGIIIAAAFMVSVEVGIATTIAVILHELPQEIGDFGLFIHAGLSKGRALLMNLYSSLFAFAGAILTIIIGSANESVTNFLVAFAAGSFIYIAGSDLVPELHGERSIKHSLIQVLSIIVGILAMFLLLGLE